MFSFVMKLHLFTFVSGIISMFTFIFPLSLNQTFFSEYSPLNIDTMAPCGGQASWHQTVQINQTRRERPQYTPKYGHQWPPCWVPASWTKISILRKCQFAWGAWHQSVQGNQTWRERRLVPGSGPTSQGGLWDVGSCQVDGYLQKSSKHVST